jgi:hypothetical protein
MTSEIPAEVRQFVTQHISSLHQIEILLLVSAAPDCQWSVEGVNKALASNTTIVAGLMEDLVEAGILQRSCTLPLYVYAPKTAELRIQITALNAIYKSKRHKIVELIYPQPSDPAASFSVSS